MPQKAICISAMASIPVEKKRGSSADCACKSANVMHSMAFWTAGRPYKRLLHEPLNYGVGVHAELGILHFPDH